MRSFPRIHRRVLRSWLCLLLLLSLVFYDTGDGSPTTAIFPFLASIPVLLSYGATVFLVPDLVLSSSTPSPAPRPHPTPVSASHYVSPPEGRWLVSYITTFDDKTLYNIAIRRPLNGTAKLVTRKHVNWIAPDEFVGASTTGEHDASIDSPTYDTPIALALIGFPGLELGVQVEDLQRLGTPSGKGHGISTSPTHVKQYESYLTELRIRRARTVIAIHSIASVLGHSQLTTIPPFTKSLQLVTEPSRSEALIKTWKKALGWYGFVGILALAAAVFLVFLHAHTIEHLIVKAVGLLRWIPEFATRCLTAAGFTKPKFVPERLLTPKNRWQPSPNRPRSGSIHLRIPRSSQKELAPKNSGTGLPLEQVIKALNERLEQRDRKPVGPPFLSPAWAKLHRPGKRHTIKESGSSSSRKIGLPHAEPPFVSSPPSKEEAKHQQAGPPDVFPDADPNHPAVLPCLHPLASSPTTSETTPEVLGNTDAVPANEKTKKEDYSALKPSERNSSGIVLSAQVSGPMLDAGSLGAPKLDSSSSVPLATVERLRAILCMDTPSSTSQPSKPQDSGAGLAAQVSGTAPKAGFLGKRLEVEAAGAYAKRSRMVVQANIDRIENANRRGKSSGRKHGGVPAARRGPALLDTIAEDLEDSTVLSDAPTVVAISSSSILPQATTNTPIEPPADPHAQDAGESRNPQDSGVSPSAQVSGTALEAGGLGTLRSRRLEVGAPVASARQSRMVIQANIDRIENGNKRGKSSGRRKEATVARREFSCLDSIAEDVEDSTVSTNTAPIATSPSSSIPTPATTNIAPEPLNNADEHPLREARAAEDAVEKKESKPKKVVTFWGEVQVQDLPMSKWDREARKGFRSEAKEREIEDEYRRYRVWVKGKQPAKGYRRLTTSAMKSEGPRSFFDDEDDVDKEGFSKREQEKAKEESKRAAGPVFYGASTSREGARPLSEAEWSRLEEYQGVRSNPAAKEVVRPQPETASVGVDAEVVFKFTFTLPLELPPPSLPASVSTTPVSMPRRIQARINARPSATSIQRARRRAAFRP